MSRTGISVPSGCVTDNTPRLAGTAAAARVTVAASRVMIGFFILE
jgi:hypothetical protein